MFRSIFFDFWETLIVFGGEPALREMRLKRARDFRDRLTRYKYNFSEADIWNALEEVRLQCEEVRNRIHKEFVAKEVTKMTLQKLEVIPLGVPMNRDDKMCTHLSRIYSAAILSMDLELRVGAKEVIILLKQKGFKIGLLSNTEHGWVERHLLEKFKINKYFDSLTFSCDVGVRKPEVDIFKLALHSLNTVPDEAVHIGDWPEMDVLGAKQSGIRAIYLKVKDRPYPEWLLPPDATIESLTQVPEALEKMLSER